MTVPHVPLQEPVTYLPGSWPALVADDLVLLADVAVGSAVLTACWNAVTHGAGVDGVLGALAQAGLGAVPNFALAGPAGDGSTRLVVSGKAQIEIVGPEPRVLSAADSPTWRDERVPGRVAVRLTGSPGDGGDAVLPVVRAIVTAAALGLGVPALATGPAPGPAAAPPPMMPAPPVPEPVPMPRVSNDTMPPRSDFDSGLIDSLPWRAPQSFGDEPAAPQPLAEPEPPQPEPGPPPSWGDPFAPAPDPQAGNPWAAAAPPAWPDPSAAPAWPDPAPAPAWPVPGTPPGGSWGQPDPAAPQYAWPDPSASAAPASPWAPGGAADAAPTGEPPLAGGADTGAGPVVHAFVCPRQHLNPPYAGSCRVCGDPIPPQEGFAAPRPSLGVLRLSTGDTVPLDRDVVLGRAPFHADENAASRPHLVQLSSPGNDISRSHVRVNLENWFVQVTDLGSTNGTVVTLPDQAPVRLRPHDPFTILPGTTVNIADEVTLRFEVS